MRIESLGVILRNEQEIVAVRVCLVERKHGSRYGW
jgi:hypothetical protein